MKCMVANMNSPVILNSGKITAMRFLENGNTVFSKLSTQSCGVTYSFKS